MLQIKRKRYPVARRTIRKKNYSLCSWPKTNVKNYRIILAYHQDRGASDPGVQNISSNKTSESYLQRCQRQN